MIYGDKYICFRNESSDCKIHKGIIKSLESIFNQKYDLSLSNVEYGNKNDSNPISEVDYLGHIFLDKTLDLYEAKSTYCESTKEKAKKQLYRHAEKFIPIYQDLITNFDIEKVNLFYVAKKEHLLVIENISEVYLDE